MIITNSPGLAPAPGHFATTIDNGCVRIIRCTVMGFTEVVNRVNQMGKIAYGNIITRFATQKVQTNSQMKINLMNKSRMEG